ncbi:unnamed protein product (macronuclear) [Paramecium tetraurelia]|uniref:Transmembrane protein n=1 Tax=Paramecium tetraurelia TaxID=5888 RepID=A0DDM4_PARTE|nr:uncharacterized protein GSPATT00015982001 [Paramecium tetraurelia]CAK81141.1 unnamed protein product [Paramecium tetraurelia]|eukprot:XP_001448538.1 hypothetical protein (macronuclear) [Paramecium tetraurelia strain d4-2]
MLILVLLPIIYLGYTQEQCQVKNQQISFFFSTQETFEWNLKDLFTGSYLNYTLTSKQPFFTLKKPIHQEYTPKTLIEGISKIAAIQARTEQNQRVWLNQFAFIEKSVNSLSIFYAQGTQGDYKPPNFNYKIVFSQNQDIQCLNLEYLNETSFLADCYNAIKNPILNYFYIIEKSGAVRNISNQNYDVQNIITKRITKVIPFVDSKKNNIKLLFRSTPAYATGSDLKTNSQIEIYNISTLFLVNQLTARDIGTLLKVDDPFKYKFSLIDFDIFSDGKLYILTAFDGIIILQIDQALGFTLIDRIQLYNDVREFDVGHFLSEDGSLVETIGVLFQSKAEVYENRIFKNSYSLDFASQYTTLLKISQELLIIQNKGKTYLINTQTKDLIHKEVLEGIQGILINQYMEELIYVTQIDARRFALSSGKLRFKSGDLTAARDVTTITAFDELGYQCQVQLNYRVINQYDSVLYAVQELDISNVFVDYPFWTPFQMPVSGPNVQVNSSNHKLSNTINQVRRLNQCGINIFLNSISKIIKICQIDQFRQG